jgi:uncharacterized SAM-binding protein YcdF (DUF218 family)
MPLLRYLSPASRWIVLLVSVASLSAAIIAAIPASRHSVLRSVGWALVAQDPPTKADIVVIGTDTLGAGVLEATDLIRAGYATRVGIFARPVTKASLEIARRGATPFDLDAVSVQLLHELGITDITMIPTVVGTADEGKVLQRWCAARSIHSVIFVSVPDHSRRARRVLARWLGRDGIQVVVRYTHFSDFDPDTWWQTRNGQRVQMVESEKLLLDILTHPF